MELSEIETLISEDHAEPLYFEHQLVGCVKPAHDIDVNLSSHVMHENLMSKASSVLALLYAVKNAGIEKSDVEYVIDCAEEACGDMNQRGGGNFAKAAAEVAGLVNATGSDARGFCAAPTHALIEAAALVKAGAYKTVVVTAGGCTAKLGMNGKDHVKKGLPILDHFYNPHHPALLKMIRIIANNVHLEGKTISICGDLAADLDMTEQFLQMGIDELSVAPNQVLALRKKIREIQ